MIFMLAIASLLCSCTKEPIVGDNHPDGELPAGMICIDFSNTDSPQTATRAYELQSWDEMRVDVADIFFYGTTEYVNKDELVKRISTSDDNVSLTDSKIIIPTDGFNLSDTYKIVVVVNGEVSWADNLPIGSPIDELNAKITSISDIASLKTPLLMSGVVDSHTFKNDPIADIDLIRQVVKLSVTVKLSEGFINSYPEVQFGGMDSRVTNADISLFKLPSHSYMMNNATLPTTSKMLYFKDKVLPWNPTDSEWTFTTYAYQNPVQGNDVTAKDGSTQFILQIPYRLTASSPVIADSYYKVYINDATSPNNPYKTLRNHLYDIKVTVHGFGSDTPDFPSGMDMTVTTNVLPWGVVEKTPAVGSNVKLSKTTFTKTGVGEVETDFPDGSNVHEDGGTVKIYCKTDVGGWYMIVRDYGKIVQNTKLTPTPVVNTTTEQSLEIVVPKLYEPKRHRYTVSIHHPIYASEPIEPIVYNFTQFAGFIPNVELLKGLNVFGKLERWPEDKLPPSGLQIAKIGNVLPTGVAKGDDSQFLWSTEKKMIFHAEGLGHGTYNYSQLKEMDAATYPIGQACVHLGPEWYVPSSYELFLIQNYTSALGLSYALPNDHSTYWSSSSYNTNDTDSYGSWIYGNEVQMVRSSRNSNNYKVRCIRNV